METKDRLDKFSRSQNCEDTGIELLYNNRTLEDIEFIPTDDVNNFNNKCNELEVSPLKLLADIFLMSNNIFLNFF